MDIVHFLVGALTATVCMALGFRGGIQAKHIDKAAAQKEQREQIDINTQKLKAVSGK